MLLLSWWPPSGAILVFVLLEIFGRERAFTRRNAQFAGAGLLPRKRQKGMLRLECRYRALAWFVLFGVSITMLCRETAILAILAVGREVVVGDGIDQCIKPTIHRSVSCFLGGVLAGGWQGFGVWVAGGFALLGRWLSGCNTMRIFGGWGWAVVGVGWRMGWQRWCDGFWRVVWGCDWAFWELVGGLFLSKLRVAEGVCAGRLMSKFPETRTYVANDVFDGKTRPKQQ